MKAILLVALLLATAPSPRLAVRWTPDAHTTVRLNAATGFRVVSLFTEDHATLTGAREVVVAEALEPELSATVTLSLQRFVDVGGVPDAMSVDVDLYATRFGNRITADFDTDPDLIVYRNLDGSAVTRGVSVAAGYRTEMQPFYANVGATAQEVFVREGGASRPLPFAPRVQGTFTVGHDFRGVGATLDWTGRVLGPMALPALHGHASRSPWFTEHHLQATKRLRPGAELYLAVRNVLDFTQSGAIVSPDDPFGPEFDPGRIYGPLQGRRVALGARYVVGR